MQRRAFLKASVALAAVSARGLGTADEIAEDGTRLVLLGTQGGPNLNAQRMETASAVLLDGRLHMVDCGYGALASLARAGFSYSQVDGVFLTHLHDDHTADLTALFGHQWTGGRLLPLGVYGPPGTARLVAAAIEFNAINEEIRLVDEARSVRLNDLFSGKDQRPTATPTVVFESERLKVSAVENNHYPEESKQRMPHRALSYRFDALDRSIVFSGDTALSPTLVALAKDADVLVCEAMDVALTRKNFEERVAGGTYADNPEGIWQHIVTTHTTTEEAGEMAAAAGVRTLVLNHLIPGGLMPEVPDEIYLAAARRHFDGEIIVGRDLQVL